MLRIIKKKSDNVEKNKMFAYVNYINEGIIQSSTKYHLIMLSFSFMNNRVFKKMVSLGAVVTPGGCRQETGCIALRSCVASRLR